MTALLELERVSAAYGPVRVLHEIDLVVEEGKISALLGANGAGKTATLRAICNLMVRVSGEIRLAGSRIDRLATEDIVRRGIAHVPDGRGTFTDLTVEENLRIGAHTRRDRSAVAGDIARVCGFFPRLCERLRQQAGTLSGGEQQMLAIARALMSRPRLLVLDEPSFGLAPLLVADIFRILRAINREEGVSILLVEQNARMALALADRAYVLETGRIALAGSAASIGDDESVRRVYLGY
jgi:branched-chain amino acid transport system ATP-binding protein